MAAAERVDERPCKKEDLDLPFEIDGGGDVGEEGRGGGGPVGPRLGTGTKVTTVQRPGVEVRAEGGVQKAEIQGPGRGEGSCGRTT